MQQAYNFKCTQMQCVGLTTVKRAQWNGELAEQRALVTMHYPENKNHMFLNNFLTYNTGMTIIEDLRYVLKHILCRPQQCWCVLCQKQTS